MPKGASRRLRWSQNTSRLIRSLFGQSECAPCPPSSSHLAMVRLNEDILRHIVPYLSPESLEKANAINYVFFNAWMESRYESLIFDENDRKTRRLLAHLGSDPDVALHVKRVAIRPWFEQAPAMNHNIWTNLHEILDPAYVEKEARRHLQTILRRDVELVNRALNAMKNIKEYGIDWDEGPHYHPELYTEFLTPVLHKWTGHLVKLTIKVPPKFLKSLASVRLRKLETLEYHFCTGQMWPRDIDNVHDGFLVFLNNLKDSLECISFISTCTSLNLDITRIYKSLGPFPKLHSVSLSAPFDGAHLSDPLVYVNFLEKHRSTLKTINILTSRCTVHTSPSDPACINWIQRILASIHTPFPQLRSLALALRPLRAPLTNVSNFLEMHMYTLDSLTLADRAFDYYEIAPLMTTANNGPLDLTGLRHLRIKLNIFCPNILYYLASTIPELTSLDIECSSIRSHRSSNFTNGMDLQSFSKEIIANKHLLVNWKLKRMAIGSQVQDWAQYIENALVECMPNLMIAVSFQ